MTEIPCNDPTCRLTREGVKHTHGSEEEQKKYRINRKKEAVKSLAWLGI